MLTRYTPTDFSQLKGLRGISDQQIEAHLKLYDGYVSNTNKLNERIAELFDQGKGGTREFAELRRNAGFEYNGMILHEYYFGNLTPHGRGAPMDRGEIGMAVSDSFGGWDAWKEDFQLVGEIRGVGWAILYQDPITGRLSNHWVTLHQDGHPAGFKPILVMDVWEHAFMLDYSPAERSKYIEAFFGNIDWDAVERRLVSSAAVRPAAA
ncbi:MAG: superoxide dismutase [Chloroflexi bacterium]|nr:superoxide dismutase [Chloroflexota bacterium]